MFKSATTYKAVLGVSLAFFFGLTLGLTLNLVGSQTSTANRTQAASAGSLRNYYCTLNRNELNARYLDTCNGAIGQQGFFGWEIVNDNHAFNGTGDGAAPVGNNTNKETTIRIGTNTTLYKPEATINNLISWSKNTRCSKVQHDGDGTENGDVFMQYVVDENNYCMIYHNDYQGKTLKLNRCKLQNLNSGTLTYWDNDQATTHPDYQPLNRLKEMYDQKCVTPTNTLAPAQPTANMNTSCAASLTGSANLSYLMKVTDIRTQTGTTFGKNEWWMCTDKSGDGLKVYNGFFGGGAMWESASAACYRIGTPNTYLNPSSNFIWYYLGKKPAGSTVASTDVIYSKNKSTGQVETKSFAALAEWMVQRNTPVGASNAVFRTKINLWDSIGTFNDKVFSTYTNTGVTNGFKINPTACIKPSNTPTVPVTPSTPPQACTYTTPELLGRGDWLGDADGHRGQTQSYSMPGLDYSKPVKIAVDWGWAGNPKNDPATLPPDLKNPQRGPVDLPGTANDKAKERAHQVNEKSDVKIQYFAKTNLTSPQLHGTINCPDVGEWKFSGNLNTPFSDGRVVRFSNTLTTNLKDITSGGDWYTCYMWNGNGAQIQPVKATLRPSTAWYEVRLNASTHANKLQFDKVFTGGPSTRAAEAVADRGSHYTRVKVSYCKLP